MTRRAGTHVTLVLGLTVLAALMVGRDPTQRPPAGSRTAIELAAKRSKAGAMTAPNDARWRTWLPRARSASTLPGVA
jgi:hypothetical protein